MFQSDDTSKKAAGIISSLVDVVKNSASKVGDFMGKAADFAIRHQNAISNVLNIGTQVVGVGADMGLIPQPYASVLSASQKALADYNKTNKKGGFVDYNTRFPL